MAVSSPEGWPPDLSSLSVDQRGSFWLGFVVRADVDLENQLRGLWVALVGSPIAAQIAPRDWNGVYRGVRQLLEVRTGDLSEYLAATAPTVLDESNNAHLVRNRLTHDVWYEDWRPDRPESFVVYRSCREMPPRKLSEFEAAHTQLMRCYWKVHGLIFTVLSELRDASHDPWRTRDPEGYDQILQSMRRFFDGSFTTPHPGHAGWDEDELAEP